jgi:hypothetical protein
LIVNPIDVVADAGVQIGFSRILASGGLISEPGNTNYEPFLFVFSVIIHWSAIISLSSRKKDKISVVTYFVKFGIT